METLHLIALETVIAILLCFFSKEMECPVGDSCKQYKQKSFRRGQGKER